MKIKTSLIVVSLIISFKYLSAQNPQPAVKLEGKWKLVNNLSDEFNSDKLDASKWDSDIKSWGTWTWNASNVYSEEGVLHLKMKYEPKKEGKFKTFFSSGIIRSKKTITYGYFEARIKAASILPGTCPAFWMKGDGPGKQSSEVDFLELKESNPTKIISTNLHALINNESDKAEWHREPRSWTAPWDPRDNYHVYACKTTPEAITWYVDGIQVTEAPNKYWKFPMYLMLSLGLRTPYRTFENPNHVMAEGSKNYPDPVTSERDKAKFPTEMLVDYVRVWEQE